MFAPDTIPHAAKAAAEKAAAEIATADVLARAAERAKLPQPDQSEARARTGCKPRERKYWLKDAIKADTAIPLRARIIGADLSEMCDIAEECAFPSYAGLMARNGIKSRDTVKRAIVDLEAAGYFVREMGAGSIGQNKYRPLWERIGLDGSTMRQRFTALPDRENEPSANDEDAPGGSAALHRGGVQDCTPGECSVAPGGSAGLHSRRQAEDKREEQQEDQQRKGAPEGAGSHAALGDEEDRPSRSRSFREPVIPFPADFAFDPVDVQAAISRGHTSDSIAKAMESLRGNVAGRKMTTSQLRQKAHDWIEREHPPKPDPDEIVHVRDSMGMWHPRKRSTVKRWDYYRDSSGQYHNKPGRRSAV